MEKIGSIRLGNSVMVSDPSYGVATWLNKEIDGVLSGDYNVYVTISNEGAWGERVKSLTVCHSEYKPNKTLRGMEKACYHIGVDSGTCGIYDIDYFKSHHNEQTANDDWYIRTVMNGFYEKREQSYITDGIGVHSCTGFGDGLYIAYVKRNKDGQIIQITIKYI